MRVEVLAAVYLLGGLTFLPLVVIIIVVYSAIALPRRPDATNDAGLSVLDELHADEKDEDLRAKLQNTDRESDVTAGYFAVCREYVAAGLNGKPPERKTPAGETIATESPSVYQSMYRSIFDRHKSQNPTIEAGKAVKRARNVFYVVLRHGHLVLFDNSEQLEVRHVISLAHYHVDIYGESDVVPEGELFIKRNAIRLHRKSVAEATTTNLAPFYLFSDNCSDKEDFYHALLQSQRKMSESAMEIPGRQEFETEDMIKLIRQLHLSDDNAPSRWFNALIGRLFLALYKTHAIERLVRNKITKKIARVQKPAFITSLALKDVSMGEGAPIFNNLKLREMTVDGAVTLEADVKYTGRFRSVIAAVAKIELGQRFKPREVNLVLSAELRRLEGHMLIKIKPPPSNRIWVSFEAMPKLEMTIEPIVSSRQITYGVIIRAIESRIREVFAETLVLPNWDDFPFTRTETESHRGGIWKPMAPNIPNEPLIIVEDNEESEPHAEEESVEDHQNSDHSENNPRLHIPQSASAIVLLDSDKTADEPASPQSPPEILLRSNSFASPSPAATSPAAVTKIPIMSNKAKKKTNQIRRDAASTMKLLSSRSQDNSPLSTPTKQNPSFLFRGQSSQQSSSPLPADDEVVHESSDDQTSGSFSIEESQRSKLKVDAGGASLNGVSSTPNDSDNVVAEKTGTLNHSLTSATAAARKWGLGMMQRPKESLGNDIQRAKSTSLIPTAQPIGRGQPLPPPGEPLPGPASSSSWTSTAFGSLKRKPVPQINTNGPQQTHQKTTSISSISSLSSFFTTAPNVGDERRASAGETTHSGPDQVQTTPSSPSRPKIESEGEELKKPDIKMKTS